MAKEVKSNFGSDGVKMVKPSATDRGGPGSGSTSCDGGFQAPPPPPACAADHDEKIVDEEDTSNSSGVQSNSYSDDFSDGGGGGGVEANLVEHVSGNGCTLTARGTMERFSGKYRVAASPHEASILEQQQQPRINQSGTQTPVGRYKRCGGGEVMDPYGPMAYFPPPPSAGPAAQQSVAQPPPLPPAVNTSSSSVNFCAYHPPATPVADAGDTLVRRHHNPGSVVSLGGVSNTSNTLGRHSRMSRQQ